MMMGKEENENYGGKKKTDLWEKEKDMSGTCKCSLSKGKIPAHKKWYNHGV